MRRKAMVVLMALALVGVMAGSGMAAWYTCTISGAGSNNAVYYITVSDTAVPPGFANNTTFFIDPTQPVGGKEMYAAALTGLSSTGKVQVFLFGAPPTQFDLCGGVFATQ